MSRPKSRRRLSVNITLARAKRLYRLVLVLTEEGPSRDQVLHRLDLGLRTFYRELELLKKSGINVVVEAKAYRLKTPRDEAKALLPFPNPGLSFAEVTELAQGQGPAAQRLAELLATVTEPIVEKPNKAKRAKSRK